MEFENDIFISYAHIDDQALIEGQKGWVSNLHRALEVRVAQLHGKPPRIWRDPKLQGNDVFGDELVHHLPKTAILLSVLSPRYTRSDWCRRELEEFHRAARAAGSLRVGTKTRIFKVVKTPVPLDQQPAGFDEILGYEFFHTDAETGRVQELDQAFGDAAQRQYWAKLDDLAHDLAEMLAELSGNGGGALPAAAGDAKTVYVARTGFDLGDARDEVARDLARRGHEVLPDQPLPLYAEGLEAYVREALARCDLSVHMIGKSYGLVPEGTTRSIVELQNEVAVEVGRDAPLARLLWTPPGLEVEDPRQREILERLRADAATHDGADLLETPLESLKTAISEILEPPEKPGARKTVYVARTGFDLHEQHDALVRSLEADGHEVLPDKPLPLFAEGLTAYVREALSRCDLSIHLIGERYAMVPEGSTRSVVEVQDEIAAELGSGGGPAQILWMPPGLAPEDERQDAVVRRLRADAAGRPAGELLEVPFAELEAAVGDRLRPPVRAEEAPADDRGLQVYLICDRRDEEAVEPLADFLFDSGLDVTLPAFEGDEGEIREDHEANLRECDAALVYYGAGNDLWIRRQLRELIKSAGYGRDRPMTARAVYVAPPATSQKRRLRTREATVVQGSEPFDPSDLQPLMQQLKGEGRGGE